MGINCDINLFKASDGIYEPGQVVSGLIKYSVDEPTELERITVSFKGKGRVQLEQNQGKTTAVYTSTEVYVDMDYIAQYETMTVPVGSYEIKFSFAIPPNIPSSMKKSIHCSSGYVKSKIKYYIRIKFEKSGMFARNKHFRHIITMFSGSVPTLSREPVIYGEKKYLSQFFTSKISVVNIKATIFNSVIPIGGKIALQYEVENDSNILVKSVEIKLVEMYTFKAKGHKRVKAKEAIIDTDIKTKAIKCGEKQIMPIEITIPVDRHSLDHSKIISRQYAVLIEVALPMPHRNAVLFIPVQTEKIDQNAEDDYDGPPDEGMDYAGPPPSYWVAMGEAKKEDDDNSDDDLIDEKSKKLL